MVATFTNELTGIQIWRLTDTRPINKYFWEKSKAEAVEMLAKKYNINKTDIKVEEDGKI